MLALADLRISETGDRTSMLGVPDPAGVDDEVLDTFELLSILWGQAGQAGHLAVSSSAFACQLPWSTRGPCCRGTRTELDQFKAGLVAGQHSCGCNMRTEVLQSGVVQQSLPRGS